MILQLAFVLTAIIIGARLGGIGLGVMGGVGLGILTFVFGLHNVRRHRFLRQEVEQIVRHLGEP